MKEILLDKCGSEIRIERLNLVLATILQGFQHILQLHLRETLTVEPDTFDGLPFIWCDANFVCQMVLVLSKRACEFIYKDCCKTHFDEVRQKHSGATLELMLPFVIIGPVAKLTLFLQRYDLCSMVLDLAAQM
ncbi:uncharacterized protein G2W53_012417 [Senna tora]|uniref:Uncharacterized protein n=1 Tax=Senna tora TaxID=362788 RepID=A0A834U3V0_9FABA|nr:uncharacterized protein G2W53_012417 [Senna tora]